MVEIKEIESKTLNSIKKLNGKASIQQIMLESNLTYSQIMRAALTLQDKKLVKIEERPFTKVKANAEGKSYIRDKLPERRILDYLNKKGEIAIAKIPKEFNIPQRTAPII
jgi:hypothetical protein